MPSYCCVPLCKGEGGHYFPRNEALKFQWRVKIKRVDPKTKELWHPSPTSVVCQKHFKQEDYTETELGKYHRLRRDAVPSIFAFVDVKQNKRSTGQWRNETQPTLHCHHIPQPAEYVEIPSSEASNSVVNVLGQTSKDGLVEQETQCLLLTDITSRFSVTHFIDDPTAILYYTGFDNYNHFLFFFNILGEASFNLERQFSLISVQDQLFLTLIKLRQAKEDLELSILFKVSKSVVCVIIEQWINFLYFQLREINVWPERNTSKVHMPENFGAQFETTRVILDATEIPVQKPKNVVSQRATFSTYKNKNTIKTVVGCSSRGLVNFISDSYGGSTSDRQIIERSSLLRNAKELFQRGDSIMADRGLVIQDLFATSDVTINTPSFLKGKTQLEPEQVIKDRRIASKRIHVERVIGLAKTYKILRKELHHSKLPISNRILFICFSLLNFRRSIVSK